MSNITTEITEANFELVRDRIASIIITEIAEQFNITGNVLFEAGIWLERFITFDKIELPVINIFYNSSNYQDNTADKSFGENKYLIEIKVSEKHTSTGRADVKASFNLQKLMRVVRYILEHPSYIRLGFDHGFIQGTKIDAMRVSEPQNSADGAHTITAQIIFDVRMQENNGDMSTTTVDEYGSQIKLDETEKGIKIELQ